QHAILVGGLLAAGGEPPVRAQLGPLVDTEDGVAVAGVDRQKEGHRRRTWRASPETRAAVRPSSSSSSSAPRLSMPRAVPRSAVSPERTSTVRPHQGSARAVNASTTAPASP